MELEQRIREYLGQEDREGLSQVFEAAYAVDIAEAIEDFEDFELSALCGLGTTIQLAAVVEEADEELQRRMLRYIEPSKLSDMFTYMSTDDIVDLLGFLRPDMRKGLLTQMRGNESRDVQLLLGYGENTAGGIMTTEYITLKSSLTHKEALDKIRTIGPKTEVIEILFVVNDQHELVGTADLRDVLIGRDDSTLYDITNRNFISVQPETDQEEVALLVSKYDLKAIPVINRRKAIIGIITVDDIIDVIVEEHDEDFLMLSGVSADERVGSTVADSVRRRLPWLFVNLLTAFLASFTVAMFEDVIVQVVALAATMPIIAGMGGNAGSQTLSLVIRSIAMGDIDLKENWRLVFKEVAIGLMNGLFIGVVTGTIMYMRYGNPYLGLIVVLAIIANLIMAAFFGFMTPLILKKVGVDPALASAIFVTAATDVFGFFVFLGLARLLLPYLI